MGCRGELLTLASRLAAVSHFDRACDVAFLWRVSLERDGGGVERRL
ncbi:hypothetical protein [Paludisphaera rhizosphaerae]|nr:hypothetical protein [Paludisphaera rhizosphaerae]